MELRAQLLEFFRLSYGPNGHFSS